MMPTKSYYNLILDDLKSKKNTFVDRYSKGFSSYFCVIIQEDGQFKAVVKSGEEIFAWARQLGLPIPDGFTWGQEADTRIVYKMLEDKGIVATDSIFLAGRDNQLFLSQVAQSEAVKIGNRYPFKGMYEEAKYLVRDYMGWMITKIMTIDPWNALESLDQAVTRIAAYFDHIDYCYKFQDIRYILLGQAWGALQDCAWPISNTAVLGFCSKTDPVLKEWIEKHPNFSYDKLYDYAIRSRDIYEAKHGRLPDFHRFSEEFAGALKTMKRTFI